MKLWILLALSALQASTLHVDVRLAQVTATVMDQDGRYVTGLTRNDFVLEENGAPQEITHFTENADTPASIGILIDTSQSMSGRLQKAADAANTLIDGLRPADEIQLMQFNETLWVFQRFTTDHEKARKSLGWAANGERGTYLVEALTNAMEEMKPARHSRRVLILITDGGESWARVDLSLLRERIRSSDILIYPIGLFPRFAEGNAAQVLLRFLAVASGGRDTVLFDDELFEKESPALSNVLAGIQAEVRDQYTLGYYPGALISAADRKISVSVKRPGARLFLREPKVRAAGE